MNICSKPDPQTDAEDSPQYARPEYQGVDCLTGVFDRAHFEVLILLDLDEFRRLKGALALVARTLIQRPPRRPGGPLRWRRGKLPASGRRTRRRTRFRTEVAESSWCFLDLTVRSLVDPGVPRRLEAMHVAKCQGRDRLFATVAFGASEKR